MHEGVLFAEPPHLGVLRRMRLISRKDLPELVRRAAIAILIGWVPLAVLSIVLTHLRAEGIDRAFFADIGTHARMLLAVPLLIAAEYIIMPRLEVVGLHFRTSSILAPTARDRFDEIVADTRRLSAGVWPSVVLSIAAYSTVLVLASFVSSESLAAWQRLPGTNALSIAGWWHLLISLPLLLGLIYAWLWRLGIWMRFLHLVAKLDLRLVASHPDRVAGLQFLARSPGVFFPLALAAGIIVAGTMANQVVHQGMPLLGHGSTPVITACVMVLLLISPTLAFSRALFVAKREGVFLYGELASRVGQEFEAKWLRARADKSALDVPDFSATTDLYGIAANVYSMHVLPFDYRSAIPIVAAALAPFVPIWLSAIPLKDVIHALIGVRL